MHRSVVLACEHLQILLLNCSSRSAAIRLLQSCCCDWEIRAASHCFRFVSGSSSSIRREACSLHPAYTSLHLLQSGAACLRTAMLASNHKEKAVSLILRTLLRTFVRIPVHLYFNSIHCVAVTQHSVTQLRRCTSSFFYSQDVL